MPTCDEAHVERHPAPPYLCWRDGFERRTIKRWNRCVEDQPGGQRTAVSRRGGAVWRRMSRVDVRQLATYSDRERCGTFRSDSDAAMSGLKRPLTPAACP